MLRAVEFPKCERQCFVRPRKNIIGPDHDVFLAQTQGTYRRPIERGGDFDFDIRLPGLDQAKIESDVVGTQVVEYPDLHEIVVVLVVVDVVVAVEVTVTITESDS